MNRFEMGPGPEVNGEGREVSPEVQKIAEGLKALAGEKNQMAMRVLCAGQGKERGSFHMEGIGLQLAESPGERLEDIQLQIEAGGKAYGLDSLGNGVEGLAQELASSGLTPEQLESFAEYVRDASSRVEKQGDQWVLTQYGPNNEGIKSFEDLLKE